MIVCSQVIEHLKDGERVFNEFKRVLKTNGTLILGTPDYGKKMWLIIEFLYGMLLPNAYADEHITKYTYSSLQTMLSQYGFVIIDKAYIMGSELIIKAQLR